jgi:ABC-2 type transport system ATP-binding protein
LAGRPTRVVLAVLGGHPRARVVGVRARVGLAHRGDDPFRAYSLGMKQRLGIAAALLGDPALLVLDEPTNGLDPLGIRDMRELLRSLAASGPTLLVSSHLLAELEQVCDWIVALDHGRRVYEGPAADLLHTGRRAVVLRPEAGSDLMALAEVAVNAGFETRPDGGRLRITGDVDDAAVADLNRAAAAAGIGLVEITPMRASLEDRYESLVSQKES